MKSRIKKLIGFVMAVVMAVTWVMPAWAANSVTLDVKNYKESGAAKKLKEERSLGSGAMKFSIPSEWKKVESPLENIEGYQYALNKMPKEMKSDAEELFLFYFSNERYLDNLGDADDREAIEQAIITNILPEKNMIGVNVPGITFPTARLSMDGLEIGGWDISSFIDSNSCYDYFDTKYRDQNGRTHNAEFVFYRNGNAGMCCALYVYTESVHKDDIIYLLRNIRTSKKN